MRFGEIAAIAAAPFTGGMSLEALRVTQTAVEVLLPTSGGCFVHPALRDEPQEPRCRYCRVRVVGIVRHCESCGAPQ